jgi:hypothetical protein
MDLIVFLLVIAVIALWLRTSRLIERLEASDRSLVDAKDQIRTLQVQARSTTPKAPPPAEPIARTPRPVETPPAPAAAPPAPGPTPASVPVPPPAAAVRVPPPPAVAERPKPAPRPEVPDASATPPSPPIQVSRETAAPQVQRSSGAAGRAARPASRTESWELTVGMSWMNKIGVLTFVIGLALAVGYSFTQIGPAGRVAIGFTLSGIMLATGVWLERRPAFRNYAYGLVAGGWAGIYFTTFAMHGVPAAKVIDSDFVAVALLSAVAAGMIGHSLRYRSQIVTSLAFVVAYATLALSPLSGFSLAASIPLAMMVLVVSQRLGWPAISVLGIAATYGVFILRSEVFPGGAMDPSASALPYLTLAAYWVTFEIADLIGLRLGRPAHPASATHQVSMLALNAAGFLGSIIVISPGTHPELRSTVMFATGTAYIASAVIRAWLLPGRRQLAESHQPFDVSHAATAVAALLFAIGIGLRFAQPQATLAWLLETQLLFVAGLTLSDRWLRRIASIVAAHVTLSAASLGFLSFRGSPGIRTDAVLAATVALIWFANRESLRIKGRDWTWLEPAYPWAGSVLLTIAAWSTFAPAHFGLALWILSAVLLESGLRRDHDYTGQSYCTGVLAAIVTLTAFLSPASGNYISFWGPAPTATDDWIVLLPGVIVCAVASVRLASLRIERVAPGAAVAVAAAGTMAAALMMVFEWRVLPANAVAPAWAVTAIAFVWAGHWRHQAAPRWLGYLMTLAAAVRQIGPLLDRVPATSGEIAAGAAVITAMYVAGYLGGRALARTGGTADSPADAERTAAAFMSLAATASLALFKYRVLPQDLVAPAWGFTGAVLAALGFYRERRGQRWQGYAMALVGALQTAGALLAVESASRALASSAAAVAAFVFATAAFARRGLVRKLDEPIIASLLLLAGTGLLVLLETRIFSDLSTGPAFTATAVVLLVIGLARPLTDLRWHGYVLLALGALRAGVPVFIASSGTSETPRLLACLAVVYVMALASRRVTGGLVLLGASRQTENAAITALLVGASIYVSAVIVTRAEPSLITGLLGVFGMIVMAIGLLFRERALRLSGLTLLLVCLLKLFLYDLRELEPLPRIFSFVGLGLVLLAISWAYTMYRDKIMKLL